MKIRYNASPIYNIILILIIVATGIFSIFNIPVLRSYSFLYSFIFIVSVGLYINTLINRNLFNKIKPYIRYFDAVTVYLVIFLVIHCIYGYVHYNEGIRLLYNVAKIFFYLLLFYAFIYIMHSKNGYEDLLKAISIIVVIYLAFTAFDALIYNFTGRAILPAVGYGLRYNRMRIDYPAFAGIAYIYYLNKLISLSPRKRSFYKYLSLVLFMIFFLFYVNMTRAYIIAYFAVTFIMILIKRRPKNKQLVIVVTIFCAIIALIATGAIDAFISSFSEDSAELGASTLARRLAREYFTDIANNNPVLGLGFVCPDTPLLAKIYWGPDGIYSLDDLGIINMFFNYGILGIILVVLIFARMLYCAVMIFIANREKSILIMGITVFIAATCASLCVFDLQRIVALPLYWAIFEYEYYHSVRKHSKPEEKKRRILGKTKINIH